MYHPRERSSALFMVQTDTIAATSIADTGDDDVPLLDLVDDVGVGRRSCEFDLVRHTTSATPKSSTHHAWIELCEI